MLFQIINIFFFFSNLMIVDLFIFEYVTCCSSNWSIDLLGKYVFTSTINSKITRNVSTMVIIPNYGTNFYCIGIS